MRSASRLAAAPSLALLLALASPAAAQLGRPDPARVTAQTAAMAPLAWMDGVWRGQAAYGTGANRREMIHTERVGPMLGGAVKVVEGKSYAGAGATETSPFDAFAVIAYDPDAKTYAMRSYAQGRASDLPLRVTADGWSWSLGPLSYVCEHRNGRWIEHGDYTGPDGAPRRVFEMTLERVGGTDWPAAGAVSSR